MCIRDRSHRIRQCFSTAAVSCSAPAVTDPAAAVATVATAVEAAAESEKSAGWLSAGHHTRSAVAAVTAASCAAAAVHEAAVLVPVTPTPTRNCPPTLELTTSSVGRCCGPLQASHAPNVRQIQAACTHLKAKRNEYRSRPNKLLLANTP